MVMWVLTGVVATVMCVFTDVVAMVMLSGVGEREPRR